MICYKDRAFCNAGVLCKVYDCDRRMTVADAEAARAQPFPVSYMDFTRAECFVPFFQIGAPAQKDMKRTTRKDMNRPSKRCKEVDKIKKSTAKPMRAEALRRAKTYMALKDVGVDTL